ncbi:hypothetical protein EDB80DRAFT_678074 [Ilyonectria destructans]|nr:hypothetical protein EDB80DRAFT_678074 [Ilyonectria destructans]
MHVTVPAIFAPSNHLEFSSGAAFILHLCCFLCSPSILKSAMCYLPAVRRLLDWYPLFVAYVQLSTEGKKQADKKKKKKLDSQDQEDAKNDDPDPPESDRHSRDPEKSRELGPT